jgi:catechol 2,3-dioxygenase-like lactoylglutathione lyase family enzyme
MMMLRLGQPEIGHDLDHALRGALADPRGSTPDVGGQATTDEVFDRIRQELRKRLATFPARSDAEESDLTDIGRVHHTGLTVRDLNRSVAFYRDLLGCLVVMEQSKVGGYLAAIVGYPGASVRMAHLKAHSGELVIELFEYVSPATMDLDLEPAKVGNAHLCLLVPDLDAVYARLEPAGVDFFSAPVDIDTGANAGGKGVYLRDPDGIILELFEPAPTTEAGRTIFGS